MKKLVLGLGTGRCGTVSLSRLLDIQEGYGVTHEMYRLPWIVDTGEFEKIAHILRSTTTPIAGDVAFYLMPYFELFSKSFDVRAVCLQRPKEEVVESYLHKTEGRNHWSFYSQSWQNKLWRQEEEWDRCFPSYSLAKKEAIGKYWDDYYTIAREYQEEYPANFRIFGMDYALNTEDGQRDLLGFVGVMHPITLSKNRLNVSKRR